jgi:3-dehydroquinate dehydratase-2
MKKVLVLHGVNLNMLGERDPNQYGKATLGEINSEIMKLAGDLDLEVECFQTNHEAEMIEKIHRSHGEGIDAVVINAGAWTHYSYALMDALNILTIPVIEVHMSQVEARESFRQHSVITPLAKGKITGFGVNSYLLGLRAARDLIKDEE